MYLYFGFFMCDYHVVLEDIWYFNKYKKQKRLLVRAFNALACKLPHCVWVAIKKWHSLMFFDSSRQGLPLWAAYVVDFSLVCCHLTFFSLSSLISALYLPKFHKNPSIYFSFRFSLYYFIWYVLFKLLYRIEIYFQFYFYSIF